MPSWLKKIKWILSAGGPVSNQKFEKIGSQRIHSGPHNHLANVIDNIDDLIPAFGFKFDIIQYNHGVLYNYINLISKQRKKGAYQKITNLPGKRLEYKAGNIPSLFLLEGGSAAG